MSPKELLYIEDALEHIKENQKCCSDLATRVQDPSLRNMLQDVCAKQNETFAKFYSLLNA